jgi:hypothetical protein
MNKIKTQAIRRLLKRNWSLPPHDDGKWRLSPDEFFGMAVLPPRVIVRYDTPPGNGNAPIVELTTQRGSKAPRLPVFVYKWKCYFGDSIDDPWHAWKGKWVILWRDSVDWKECRCTACAYLPVIRVKATRILPPGATP